MANNRIYGNIYNKNKNNNNYNRTTGEHNPIFTSQLATQSLPLGLMLAKLLWLHCCRGAQN